MRQFNRLLISISTFLSLLILWTNCLVGIGNAQTPTTRAKLEIRRVLRVPQRVGINTRTGGYRPSSLATRKRSQRLAQRPTSSSHQPVMMRSSTIQALAPTGPIIAGTSLARVLHTSQLTLNSSAGTNEQFVDRTRDLIADDRTTFDSDGGSFDIAVGQSGARYEVYSAVDGNTLLGALVVATDSNGDFVANTSEVFDLERDFDLPSAAAVVTGLSSNGREFVIVSSSGYFNSDDPNDPNNEPSPGVILLVRNSATGGFDESLSRTLVTVGDNKLFNANALALMPNNDLLIADFASNELRIVRDTNGDRIPDTLDTQPYYSYQFSDDAPLDIAVNSRGVVFSHSEGNDTILLAIYDDNSDGRADHDEVVVEGLSIDNNLFLHGLTIDRLGNVYVIEDATSSEDGTGGNGGIARVDAFPDPNLDGFLDDGKVFAQVDGSQFGFSGLGLGPNRLDDTSFFVRQHDATGFPFWVNNIDSCGVDVHCREVKRIDTSAAFFLSIEFQQTGFLVHRLYKASFPASTQRPRGLPRFQEFLADSATIGNGVIVGATGWEAKLAANTTAFVAAFVSRAEFQTSFPLQMTAAQYVDKLNTQTGGALSTTERNNLVAGLSGGQETRASVLLKVANNVDFTNAEFNKAFVLMQYFGYLRRNPDDAPDLNFSGYDFWLTKLNQFNGNFRAADMVKAFLVSREYIERF
jgi:hypothetical protein